MAKSIHVDQFHVDLQGRGTKQSYLLTFEVNETNNVVIPVQVIKGDSPGPTLLILAAVHGDEYEGVHTVIELCRDLQPEQIKGTVILVSVTNMLAYNGISRTTPEDGCNLAREFPGRSNGTVTQRLAWHIHNRLMDQVDFLLDLHSGGTYLALKTFVGYYHHDSDVGRRSQAAAEAFGMSTIWGHEHVLPGRTVTTATEKGIPWLYTEGYGGGRVNPEEQQSYRLGALRLMDHLGLLLHVGYWIQETAPPILHRLRGDGHFDLESSRAAEDGFFIPEVKLGDIVRKGDRVGALYDWFGIPLQICIAEEEGMVVCLAGSPKVTKGLNIFMIASEWNKN